MNDQIDSQLLRAYAENRSEAAFAELVRRHVDFVYSAARRMVVDPHLAEDVTQSVFVAFAKNARQLTDRPVLSGWLHRTAQNIAAQTVRTIERRRAREQEAVAMNELLAHEPDAAWENIAPHLDVALGELSEPDRDVLLLRYFEKKSAREMAQALNVSEEAAQKRVNRAVERLREFFSKRNVTIGASGLVVLISTNSVSAAPTALATSISAAAIAKAAAASGSTLNLFKGTLKIMAWSKAKTSLIVGVGLLVAGTAKVAITEIAAHRTPIWQEKYDLSVLDMVAPQTKILSPPPSRTANVNLAGVRNGKRIGWGKDFPEIVTAAYGWQFNAGQLIFSVPVPKGRYDFISNLPKGQNEAMQQEIKKKFGLIERREMIETNVLILKVRSANATGLRRTSGGRTTFAEGSDSLVSHNQSLVAFVDFLRRHLGILVLNRTKFRDDLDIDLKWDGTPEGLKQAMLDQLGLELVPAKEPVEFLVVEKAN